MSLFLAILTIYDREIEATDRSDTQANDSAGAAISEPDSGASWATKAIIRPSS
jgi:hypothetical protein